MRKLLVLIVVLMTSRAFSTEDHWFCTDDQSFKEGNLYAVCGTGTYSTEGEARIKALDSAIREFDTLCKHSADCNGKKKTITPKRSSCSESAKTNISSFEKFTCHRLFIFAVQ